MKKKVLFVCVHNSARSQMAEEFLRKLGGEFFEAESCGFIPSSINPLVLEVMKEEGVDLSNKKTQSVFDLYKENRLYSFVITVCDRAREKDCPVFPGIVKRLHWNLENPEDFSGTHDDKIEKTRELMIEIKQLVIDFINEYKDSE
ncbi:MAG: arsenate reductase ArsC [Clostridia bacterium]|nr:arsenate reductase ArsC [Clostridia bacterium]MBN2883365.1 arsenate reductase ArsC [Clostridia bacterium]